MNTLTRMPKALPKLTPALKLFGKYMIKGNPRPSHQQLGRFGNLLMQGDPLADDVVKMYKRLPAGQGRRLLDQALNKGIGSIKKPPAELVALFAQIDSHPMWLNPALMKKAAFVAQRSVFSSDFVLRDFALMGGYQSAAFTKPLVFTGDLDGGAHNRLVETTEFWADATRPGGMDRFADGFKSAVMARIMNALLRQRMEVSSDWDSEQWGLPINQADLISTSISFSFLFILGQRMQGYRFSKDEVRATLHLWKYIGYVMGADVSELPTTEEEARRMLYLITLTLPAPDEESRKLARALKNKPLEEARAPWQKWLVMQSAKLHDGYSYYFMGRDMCQTLGLKESRYRWLPLATLPAIYGLETLRMRLPYGNHVASAAGVRYQELEKKLTIKSRPAKHQSVVSLDKQRAKAANG